MEGTACLWTWVRGLCYLRFACANAQTMQQQPLLFCTAAPHLTHILACTACRLPGIIQPVFGSHRNVVPSPPSSLTIGSGNAKTLPSSVAICNPLRYLHFCTHSLLTSLSLHIHTLWCTAALHIWVSEFMFCLDLLWVSYSLVGSWTQLLDGLVPVDCYFAVHMRGELRNFTLRLHLPYPLAVGFPTPPTPASLHGGIALAPPTCALRARAPATFTAAGQWRINRVKQ